MIRKLAQRNKAGTTHDSTNSSGSSTAITGFLQGRIALTGMPNLCAALRILAPLGAQLQELALFELRYTAEDTPAGALQMLKALPALTCLNIAEADYTSASILAPILFKQ